MTDVHIHLKDYSGRDFGGDFSAVRISMKDGGFIIDLEYSGKRSSKRLGVASISIERKVVDELCLLHQARPWPERKMSTPQPFPATSV